MVAELVQQPIRHAIHERRYEDARVLLAQMPCLVPHEFAGIDDVEPWGELLEVALGRIALPPGAFDQPVNHPLASGGEVHHPALIMADEGDGAHVSDSDRERDLELQAAEVRSARAHDVGEVVGYPQSFTVVHTHPDQQLGPRVMRVGRPEIVIGEKIGNGSPAVGRQNITWIFSRNDGRARLSPNHRLRDPKNRHCR